MSLLLELLADLLINLGIAALPRRAQIGCLLVSAVLVIALIVLVFGYA